MIKRLTGFILVFVLVNYSSLFSKGTSGNNATYESIRGIDMPTAGVIPKDHFRLTGQFFNGGGILIEANYSPLKNLVVGTSFSGSGLVGTGDIVFQKYPGIFLRFRLLDETRSTPAFCIGFESQGHGEYLEDFDRFTYLSPGFYLSVSKAFKWYPGNIAWHGGLCYSLEPTSEDRSLNAYVGFEQSIGSVVSLNSEFNLNLDENDLVFEKPGLLSISLRVAITEGLTGEFQLSDLLGNLKRNDELVRFMGFEYIWKF